MTGQTNLQKVLASMQLGCDDTEYGFATLSDGTDILVNDVLGTFYEAEGLTVIANIDYLKSKQYEFEGPFAKLTVEVHTSLELVGLTAVLATKLAEAEISANVVAAYFHDHVFVQYDLRSKAMDALNALKG